VLNGTDGFFCRLRLNCSCKIVVGFVMNFWWNCVLKLQVLAWLCDEFFLAPLCVLQMLVL
jgi:hypothetical protein